MWGFSGGGHLTLGFLATENQKKDIKAASIFSAGIHPWWEVQREYRLAFYVKAMSPSREDTKNITIPLFHIQGRLDNGCIPECAEALEKIMKECDNKTYKLVWYENAGHMVMKDVPDAWPQTLKFLRSALGLPEIQ